MYSDHYLLLNTARSFHVTRMNPFIFVAWRCTMLEELVLLGKYFNLCCHLSISFSLLSLSAYPTNLLRS